MAGIRVVPQAIWAVPNERFLVRARLIDETGNVYPDERAADLRWTSPNLTLEGDAKGPAVVVSLPAGATGVFALTAQLEGYPSVSVPVYATAMGVSPIEIDVARSASVAATPPVFFLVKGRAPGWNGDSLFAVVGRGALDYLECESDAKCGEITVFSVSHGLIRQTEVAWSNKCDDVDTHNPSETAAACLNAAAIKMPQPELLTVQVQYVILASGARSSSAISTSTAEMLAATDDENTVGTVRTEVGFAAKVLAEGWTGLHLPIPETIIRPGLETSVTLAIGAEDPCVDQPTSVAEQLIGVTVDPRTITVAYVQQLLKLDGTPVEYAKGFACPWNEEHGSIVLLSWIDATLTTLAHELAHVLGPWQTESPWGHTEGIAGFNESNILWNYESDTKPGARSQMSLGQAFRLSLDKNSFFHRGTSSSLPRCQFWPTAAEEDAPCPSLSLDVVSP